MTRPVHVTRAGDVVDLIALAAYGRTAGATEAILAANPGLAARGPVLDAGLEVVLPLLPAQADHAALRLWD